MLGIKTICLPAKSGAYEIVTGRNRAQGSSLYFLFNGGLYPCILITDVLWWELFTTVPKRFTHASWSPVRPLKHLPNLIFFFCIYDPFLEYRAFFYQYECLFIFCDPTTATSYTLLQYNTFDLSRLLLYVLR